MKKIYAIVGVTAFGVVIIAALHFYTNRNADRNNGFSRTFSKAGASLQGQVVLDNELYSIAGSTPRSVRLYKYKKPNEMVDVSTDRLEQSPSILLPLPDSENFRGMNAVAINDTLTFLLSGITSNGYKIYPDRTIVKSRLDTLPFYQAEMVGNSFVFVSRVKEQSDFRRKIKKTTWQGKEMSSYMPEKQIDGYYCTDGQFKYDRNANVLVYMYYYRGDLVCLDTNLSVLYHVKTIDTVSLAKLQLQLLKGKLTHAAPPALINKRCCLAGDRIYINANLKADNQKLSDFTDAETIDVYDLKKRTYLLSFYLPKIGKQKLTEFRVSDGRLIALYRNTLAVFSIPSS